MVRKLAAATAAVVALGTSYLSGGAWAVTDPTLPVPSQPSLRASGDSVIVSWAPVAGATGYHVEISLNAGAYVDAGSTDGATYSLEVDDLRSASLCGPGPCTVRAEVATTNGGSESTFSVPSDPVALPLPYTIPMSVWRHNGTDRVTLVLYGASSHPGQVVHLYKLSRDKVWEDTGRATAVHVQRVPGHHRALRAWLFRIVVRARGLSNYRVEIPAAGQLGEGTSRPYGVRR